MFIMTYLYVGTYIYKNNVVELLPEILMLCSRLSSKPCYSSLRFIKIYLISFTLYPAYSRVGRGNLVLRNSVPHFLPNSGGFACRVIIKYL